MNRNINANVDGLKADREGVNREDTRIHAKGWRTPQSDRSSFASIRVHSRLILRVDAVHSRQQMSLPLRTL
jgi:hypothetical protein